jgi:serine/threonine-protein kinase
MKAPLGERPDFLARFRREAEIATSLRHPAIVRVHEYDVAGEFPFMVMDLLAPDTLAAWIERDDRLAPPIAVWIADVAAALDYAHRHGVVHRDVKPANVLVSHRELHAFVTDFGIARIVDTPGLTRTGLAIGSFSYMSPEQCQGVVHSLDHRADVYSFAAMLFEVATGRVPFGRGPAALSAHLRQPPPSARRINPALPRAIDAVLARGLAKLPGDRYPSAGALAHHFLDELSRRGRGGE